MEIWKKLNLKGQRRVRVDDDYAVMEPFLPEILDKLAKETTPDVDFYMGFASESKELPAHFEAIAQLTTEDPVVWLCYPKKSSPRYQCDINRDQGWAEMGALGFEPVRQVSLDGNWSALRFRRVTHIKSMVRKSALTEDGKRKAADG